MFETASAIYKVIMKSESVVDTSTKHLVCTAIDICTAQSGIIIVLRFFSIIFVGSPHVTNVQGSSFS